ncbi:MAG: DUF1194 domain-containing protein, partial [Maritimibacter harenae]
MRWLAALFLSLWLVPPALAEDVWVDVELVLMVDVSRSMSEHELEIQRVGYAEALRSDPVLAAIQSGYFGRIAVTYVEWAGTQQIVVPWRVLESRADLDAFAADLSITFNPALRRTSISEALYFGARLFEGNGYAGDRRVIDISGDGPNNLGRPVDRARDAVVGQGIVVNGLPLMTREGLGAQWHLEGLDLYYETCVIGGLGAFVLPVYDWDDFPEAVQRKMVMEIVVGAAPPPRPRPERGQNGGPDPRACPVG